MLLSGVKRASHICSQHSLTVSAYLNKLKGIVFSMYSWLKLRLLPSTPAHLSLEGWMRLWWPGVEVLTHTHSQTQPQKTPNILASADHADCVICTEHKGMLRKAGQGAGVQNGGVLREWMLEKFKGRFSNSINRKYQRSVHTERNRE